MHGVAGKHLPKESRIHIFCVLLLHHCSAAKTDSHAALGRKTFQNLAHRLLHHRIPHLHSCVHWSSVCSPYAYIDPLHANMNTLFVELFKDALNEYAYAAEIAGLGYNLSCSLYGISVRSGLVSFALTGIKMEIFEFG